MIDPDTLTVGELAAFEDVADVTIQETIDGLRSGLWVESGKFLLACLLVSKTRAGESVTLEDVAATPLAVFADHENKGQGS